ncbi:GlxA family transcriptional regulator [Rhodococcus sp. NPDC003318]|uniref:GlxA family transcriptional regulator n=1 Tax=Rhodococcus sp. NPDC003318 TaxID=3364503 RepID=UPI0036C706FD
MHRVVVLALDGVVPFELGIPSRIFGMAENAAGERLYEVMTCTPDGGPVRTEADFSVSVDHGPELLASADTVVIPATYDLGSTYNGHLPDHLGEVLAFVRPDARYVAICIGGYVLAAAGLLDGLRATTHWRHAEHFQRTYPRVRVDPDVLFVDEGQVLTSAGVAAGLDLCLHVVRRDHGADVATRVAKRSVVPAWRDGGQAQFIERPVPAHAADSTAATRDWALQRLDEPLQLSRLARHANMSVRTFTRRFADEVGTTPAKWLITHRVDRARQLLETTDLSVDVIAADVGFGTATSLRQHMAAQLGVPPSAYRKTFRGQPAAEATITP